MDGRPHPPEYAPHTWMGFSTGKWEGDILTVYTTHIKSGVDPPQRHPQQRAVTTMIEHFIRHGNILTHLVSSGTDPVYLTEPLVKSDGLRAERAPGGGWLWPCEYVDEIADGRSRATCRTICPARVRSRASSPRSTAFRSKRRAAAPRRCIRSTWRS